MAPGVEGVLQLAGGGGGVGAGVAALGDELGNDAGLGAILLDCGTNSKNSLCRNRALRGRRPSGKDRPLDKLRASK